MITGPGIYPQSNIHNTQKVGFKGFWENIGRRAKEVVDDTLEITPRAQSRGDEIRARIEKDTKESLKSSLAASRGNTPDGAVFIE